MNRKHSESIYMVINHYYIYSLLTTYIIDKTKRVQTDGGFIEWVV